MFKTITKKSMAILMLVLTLLSTFSNFALATEISEAFLQNKGHCGHHLQYYNATTGAWSYVEAHYVVHTENGKEYPAYCLNVNVPGVGEKDDYSVDISKVLDDVRIWRTIINGYPYKTPAQLGVENEYDAFIATKQAVYCILYNYDAPTRYRGGDERGTKIANAIVNMVNEGRNGTQTPYTAGITANKVGELKEDGDYYSQEFQVNCGVNISLYNITSNSGLPAGSQITNMSNNAQTTFIGSEHFKIRIPKNEMNKDVNAILALQAKAETYPIFYGETRIPGTQDYAVTYDPIGDVTGTLNLNVKANTGKIKVVKNDAETNKPIQGVTFQLSTKDGKVIANATTNSEGVATFSSLYQNSYVLKEISTNENYILNEESFEVNVEYNKTETKTITNEHKRGDIKIYKIDADNKKVVLGNVEFQLWSEEFGKVIGTYNTDVNRNFRNKIS